MFNTIYTVPYLVYRLIFDISGDGINQVSNEKNPGYLGYNRGLYYTAIWGLSGQIITTSAEVTLNGGLIRELPQNPLNSGLGIILICPGLS